MERQEIGSVEERQKRKVVDLMLRCARNSNAVQALLDGKNTYEANMARMMVNALVNNLKSLPNEFYTKRNVADIHSAYYDEIIKLTHVKRNPNEELGHFIQRSKAIEKENGKVGGLYDTIDTIAMFVVGEGHSRNPKEIYPGFSGLSTESLIMLPGSNGDGKNT